jgi:TIR domain-containing protein
MPDQLQAAGAVFLSYASDDAEAAARITEGLRSAGIEVWFDREELRGGDAWDLKIKRQIHECALFLPLISARTNTRTEGYFRREWKLATHRPTMRSFPRCRRPRTSRSYRVRQCAHMWARGRL